MRAVSAVLPLAIAVIPWGILTGALGMQIGLSPWQAQAMSLLVFGGAAQLSGLTLIAGGAGLPAILGSTAVISSRHLLYSMVFRQHMLTQPWYRRWPTAFFLTDEMFAVSEAQTRSSGRFSSGFALVAGFTFWVIWNLATLAGILLGEGVENLDQLGLDFAIIATFVAMTFDNLKNRPVVVAMLVSGSAAVLLKPYLSDSYIIIAALLGMLAAYTVSSDAVSEPEAGP
ncbi:MAG: AzlC family ABC transporter permease [Gammaproteobacteria bacterium]|nr:AzlC family ABC transporter permease [Gammaproteobacteria bacterium]